MSIPHVLGALTATLALATVTLPAQASPTVWQRAADPSAGRRGELKASIERMVARASIARSVDSALPRNFLRAALALLELSKQVEGADPELDLLMGELLVHDSVGRLREGRGLLERALAQPLSGEALERGHFWLAIACAKLGDPTCERAAYDRALELAWQRGTRGGIHLNRAEAKLALGDVKGALADYREAARLAASPLTLALAYYGLAMAHDRDGDLPAALDAASRGNQVKLGVFKASALDHPDVFFAPPWDAPYYHALAALAAARDAPGPVERRAAEERALLFFRRFLAAAPETVVYRRHAERHAARLEAGLTLRAAAPARGPGGSGSRSPRRPPPRR